MITIRMKYNDQNFVHFVKIPDQSKYENFLTKLANIIEIYCENFSNDCKVNDNGTEIYLSLSK